MTLQPQKIKRIPLPHGIRHEVFKRDNYKCVECGASKIEITLHIDHIIPISRGGTDEMSNLRTLCQPCNSEKSDLLHKTELKKDDFTLNTLEVLEKNKEAILKLEPQDVKGSCCTEKSTRMITYDCGPDGFETYLVCDLHYKDEAWSRFAISRVDLK